MVLRKVSFPLVISFSPFSVCVWGGGVGWVHEMNHVSLCIVYNPFLDSEEKVGFSLVQSS